MDHFLHANSSFQYLRDCILSDNEFLVFNLQKTSLNDLMRHLPQSHLSKSLR